MNYEPNTRRWNLGDIVIHDADAKKVEYLMIVIALRNKDGEVRTQYLDPRWSKDYPGGLENEEKFLHDPRQFGLSIPLMEKKSDVA